jgi:hypothetical protein
VVADVGHIQRVVAGPTAERLDAILQPMDDRFDPARNSAKKSRWLDRDISALGWAPSDVSPDPDDESMNE